MTSIDTSRRAIALAATALTISAITAPPASARPSQTTHQLLDASPAASTPASHARAASMLSRATHEPSADPHRLPITPVGISTLPHEFTRAVNRRGVAIVNVAKPAAPAAPWISRELRNVGPAGLIVRYGTHDPPPARNRHAPTDKFSSDGKEHIPAGDLHTDPAAIRLPRPPRAGHVGAQAVAGGMGAARSALTAPVANALSPPPLIPAPLRSGPARAAPAAPPTPPRRRCSARPRQRTPVVAVLLLP